MNNYETPEIGSWYRRLDRPQPFQVVAFDQDEQTVDIEYFDGTLDEWPMSHWRSLPIEPCAPPEDSSGPFDNVEDEGLQLSESSMPRDEWEIPPEVEGLTPDAESITTEGEGDS